MGQSSCPFSLGAARKINIAVTHSTRDAPSAAGWHRLEAKSVGSMWRLWKATGERNAGFPALQRG